MLLFFTKKITFGTFTFVDLNEDINRLWLVISMVGIIIFVKFFFRALIPDKPKWVEEEEERQNTQKEMNKGRIETKFIPAKLEKEISDEKKKIKAKLNNMRSDLEKAGKKIKELENEKEKYKLKLKEKHNENNISSLTFHQNPVDYKAKVLSLFLKTYKFLEHELLVLRLKDISKYDQNNLYICNECHQARSVFECLDCQENFCKHCYDVTHITTHKMIGKPAPTISGFNKTNQETMSLNEYKLIDRIKYIRDKKTGYYILIIILNNRKYQNK